MCGNLEDGKVNDEFLMRTKATHAWPLADENLSQGVSA